MIRAKWLTPALIVTIGGMFFTAGCNAPNQPKPESAQPPADQTAAPAPDDCCANPTTTAPRDDAKTQVALALGTAVEPKPLSDQVKKGLEYLIKQQNLNGGWGQGGGWRAQDNGGRIEGAQDPPDVGNTCLAVLALVRAGNSPKEGPYAKNVAKAVEFICSHIDKSDDKSLYVTDVKGTQLQSKIGAYVDTFLASMVLSELKGRMPNESSEKQMVASLTKTVRKMEANQQKDGTFAGNHGWASILSQSLANKGFARASQNGIALDDATIAKVQNQVAANFDPKSATFSGGVGGVALGGYGGISGTVPAVSAEAAGLPSADKDFASRTSTIGTASTTFSRLGTAPAPSNAGVSLYTASSNLTNAADVSNTYKQVEREARKVLAKKDAPKAEKDKAEATLRDIEKNETLRTEATKAVVKQLDQPGFVQGFGTNGGEEFLSFMNISEALLLKGGDDWKKWDKTVTESITRVQDGDGSWSGQHCITGKTACTAAALLVLMADRAPVPVAVASEKVRK